MSSVSGDRVKGSGCKSLNEASSAQVYLRERRKCKIGVFTHLMALFTLALPHLAAAAALLGRRAYPDVQAQRRW